jgi:hypothetical protein
MCLRDDERPRVTCCGWGVSTSEKNRANTTHVLVVSDGQGLDQVGTGRNEQSKGKYRSPGSRKRVREGL